MRLVGANPAPRMAGLGELPGKVNYFLGNDPARWRAHIATYAEVRCEAVYPGVDLLYYGNQRQLEYDFVVAPGVDPAVIRLGLGNAETLEVNASGELVVGLAGAEVRMHKPVIYQERNGQREPVSGGYVLLSPATGHDERMGQVGFRVAEYDRSQPLVIDPVLVYSTYLGGTGNESIADFVVDAGGNAHVTGRVDSAGFPTANPAQAAWGGSFDVYVTKLSPTGAVVYSTYIGGSGVDNTGRFAVDASGNAYLASATSSTNFPITPSAAQLSYGGGSQDAFVTKLDPSGALVYSTYIGGNSSTDSVEAFAVDASGNAYVAGFTNSANFPTVAAVQPALAGGFFDTFVTKLDPMGSFVYSTYLGGISSDAPRGVAVDASGNAHVVGFTFSPNFPTFNPAQPTFGGGPDSTPDVFVTVLDSAGQFVYSTYLGGSLRDDIRAFALDTGGNTYVAGSTGSTNLPTLNAPQPAYHGGLSDCFVAKLNPAGGLVYSTYLGGTFREDVRLLATDASQNVYIVGATESVDFPTLNAAKSTYGGTGFQDAFVTKLNAAGALVYSTYLGGEKNDTATKLAVDAVGNAYVAGSTASTTFPTVNAAQATFGGGTVFFPADVFVTKLNPVGAFVFSTYLGGSLDDGSNFDMAVDASGNVYFAGVTSSTNFPTANALQPALNGGQDAFVTKLNAAGGFIYSTFLGGSGNEGASRVAADASGNAYVAGSTTSADLPVAAALQPSLGGATDVFVAKIAANASPVAAIAESAGGDEGSPIPVDASPSSDDIGIVLYEWDCENDGTFDVSSANPTGGTCTYPDDGIVTLRLRVTDQGGLKATASTTVEILNVPPMAMLTASATMVYVNTPVTLALASPFDPSVADAAAGFSYAWDCNNDGTFEAAGPPPRTIACSPWGTPCR